MHIGIYADRAAAEAAIVPLRDKPGFRDHPDGFEIHAVVLGATDWTEGFTTFFGGPPRDAEAEAFNLPAWAILPP